MFWKKPKPKPWYRKLWDEWRQLFVSLTTVFGVLASGYSYIAIDPEPFIKTTQVTAVSANGRIYVEMDAATDIAEKTYFIVSVGNQQIHHQVYPNGLTRGTYVIDTPVPFNLQNEDEFKLNVDIVFMGVRTLFMPEQLTLTRNVRVTR